MLDYFGQTVNIAARLQSEAQAGDLVLSEELAELAAAGGSLAGTRVTERYGATLKGVDRAVPAVRLRRENGAARSAAAG